MYKFEFILLNIALVLKLGFILVDSTDDFPSYFPKCKRSDPNLEECVLNATEQVRPYVMEGVDNLIPAFKTFTVPRIVLEQYGSRAMNFKIKITNLTILGLEHYKFTRFIFNPQTLKCYVSLNLPHLYLDGKYDLVGNLFFANLKGNGNFYGNLSDTSFFCNYTLTTKLKNRQEYLKITEIVPKLDIGSVKDYAFDGLFQDNKDLEIVTTNIVKHNLRALLDEITPAIEPVIAAFFEETVSKPLLIIPYDKIFPK